jgi:S-adenosylmethionine-diacylglycerol 3-amino-3-carboxypropyl transferase
MSPGEWLSGRVFQFVHEHNLVYNTCWEDPRLDRIALELRPHDTVLVITSAGCNALDYALAGPERVIAVDLNPRQNALLELKLAGIRKLSYEDFFAMFGCGRLDQAGKIYQQALRGSLSPEAQRYWDRWIEFFEPGGRRPFYYRGTCGTFALLVNLYINRVARLRPRLDALLEAASVDEQRQIYQEIHDRIWTPSIRFAMNRDATLSLLGVPRAQRRQIETQCGGIHEFVHDCLEAVFGRLPLADNYFWRVYLTGRYTPQCCPEYLKPENFQRLKAGLADRVEVHTDSVQGFLEKTEAPISRFALLDHMDWLAGRRSPLLAEEWQWIIRRAGPETRLIWRSGGLRSDFVDDLRVAVDGTLRHVGELLTYHREMAQSLHQRCRVHTYGSFYIADLAA